MREIIFRGTRIDAERGQPGMFGSCYVSTAFYRTARYVDDSSPVWGDRVRVDPARGQISFGTPDGYRETHQLTGGVQNIPSAFDTLMPEDSRTGVKSFTQKLNDKTLIDRKLKKKGPTRGPRPTDGPIIELPPRPSKPGFGRNVRAPETVAAYTAAMTARLRSPD